MNDPDFAPGFRFSRLDAVILTVAAATALVMWVAFWIGVSIAFVVLHFFLFCNLLRMSRPLELTWAGCFAALAMLAAVEWVTWPIALGGCTAVTVVVAAVEMRRPSYHGVGWQRINPDLPAWWRTHQIGN